MQVLFRAPKQTCEGPRQRLWVTMRPIRTLSNMGSSLSGREYPPFKRARRKPHRWFESNRSHHSMEGGYQNRSTKMYWLILFGYTWSN